MLYWQKNVVLVFFVSLSAIHSAVMCMLQKKSLAILNIPVLGSRLYKLKEILIQHFKKKTNLS